MNLRRKQPPDSLYMLLDTMCNAFGGIILLAVLVTLLTSSERSGQQANASDSHELLDRRLALAKIELQNVQELSVALQGKAHDERYKKLLELIQTRKELQNSLDQAQDAIAEITRELNSTEVSDPADRLKSLNTELANAENQKLGALNSLNATRQNNERLKQRIQLLDGQVSKVINELQRPLRLPRERETGKRPFYIIVQYGRVYPCRNADFSRNEKAIAWTSSGESEIAQPIREAGYTRADELRLRALLSNLPKDLVFVAFCVFDDSFNEFNWVKELATSCNLAYGWEPFRAQVGPVAFSSTGHRPKPQ